MLHIPILRRGKPYRSLSLKKLQDHRTAENLAEVSQANSGLIVKDIAETKQIWKSLRSLKTQQVLEIFSKAGDLFLESALEIDGVKHSPEEFTKHQAATTGMPESMCLQNMQKIHYGFKHIDTILSSLMGVDINVLDTGHGLHNDKVVAYSCHGKSFGAVLPNNSPGVNTLWLPVVAMRIPMVIKPGAQDPWTPLRVYRALVEAGYPEEAVHYYPTDHGGGSTILVNCDRGMVFGDVGTVGMWMKDPRIEVHGPGHSKVILDEEAAENWEQYLDVMVSSIVANGGRSCVNASAVWTPKNGKKIADALAKKLATVTAKKLDDPEAQLAGFSNPKMAEYINNAIEKGLVNPEDEITARYRTTDRLVNIEGTAFLQPTVIYCDSLDHPLAEREFLFPYASVVEIPQQQMLDVLPYSLVVSAITNDANWKAEIIHSGKAERINFGAFATWQVDWNQPHEGNLFEMIYHRISLQESAI